MNTNTLMSHVQRLADECLEAKGAGPAALSGSTPLLGGGLALDSLDLASIVVNLTEITGRDPFAEGFIAFRTVDELVALYAD